MSPTGNFPSILLHRCAGFAPGVSKSSGVSWEAAPSSPGWNFAFPATSLGISLSFAFRRDGTGGMDYIDGGGKFASSVICLTMEIAGVAYARVPR